MATVFLAKDLGCQERLVAVKLLNEDIACNPVNVERFEDEFRASFGLKHPNVLRSYDLFYDAGVGILI